MAPPPYIGFSTIRPALWLTADRSPKYRKSPYIPVRVYMSLFFAYSGMSKYTYFSRPRVPVRGYPEPHLRAGVVCTKSVGRVFSLSEAEAGGGGRCFPQLYNTLPNITCYPRICPYTLPNIPNITRYPKIGGIRPYGHGGYNTLPNIT